ncbi:MAG: hypothetical protein KA715_14220 [Xanthomonadaceae bacterium]|nr:hypothetical protein [Xanthomonadaceae bacterium]
MKLNNPRAALIVLGLFFVLGLTWWALTPKKDQSITEGEVLEVASMLATVPGDSTGQPKQIQTKEKSYSDNKLDILNQVLSAHDDNDMRLDTELKFLTTEEKRSFIDRYQALPFEDRNGRGTIVFLIGRNLTTQEDFKFISNIFLEPYCRSLANCSEPPKPTEEDPHLSGTDEVTLSYPQLTAMKALEKLCSEPTTDSNSAQKSLALEALRVAEGFDHPKIQAYSRKVFAKCGG